MEISIKEVDIVLATKCDWCGQVLHGGNIGLMYRSGTRMMGLSCFNCKKRSEKWIREKDQSWRKVWSSNIKSVYYDPVVRELTVEFIGGSRYRYNEVPVEVYKEFMRSESKGRYFNSNIKKGFKYEKIIEKGEKK